MLLPNEVHKVRQIHFAGVWKTNCLINFNGLFRGQVAPFCWCRSFRAGAQCTSGSKGGHMVCFFVPRVHLCSLVCSPSLPGTRSARRTSSITPKTFGRTTFHGASLFVLLERSCGNRSDLLERESPQSRTPWETPLLSQEVWGAVNKNAKLIDCLKKIPHDFVTLPSLLLNSM